MSFAIIETGGKQYKVAEGDSIQIEKLSGIENEGEKVTFDKVLLVNDGESVDIGEPYLSGVVVEGTFEETAKGKKIDVIRFRSKSRYHRKYGHRQPYSQVTIGKVGNGDKKSAPKKAPTKKTSAAHVKTEQKPEDIGVTESTSKASKSEKSVKTPKSRNTNKEVSGEMKETESKQGKEGQK